MITKKRVSICLRTIASICSSPSLDQYLIGFTSMPAQKKGDQYRSMGFGHFVVLADHLSSTDALQLERLIQEEIFNAKEGPLYRKYHAEKTAFGRLISSAGGVAYDPTAKACSVYMVWWDREATGTDG